MPSMPLPAAALMVALCTGAANAEAPAPTLAEAEIAARMVDAICLRRTDPVASCTTAMLLTSDDLDGMVDLIIAPSDGAPVIIARHMAMHGPGYGERARLEPGPIGTLLIQSEQSTQGRYPRFETLTVGQSDGRYQVIAYHYSTYDRPMGGDFSCSVDLVAGDWRASGVRVDPESGEETQVWDASDAGYGDATDVEWWSYREPPAHCDEVMDAWFAAGP